jgi:hypothetical protein
MSRWGTYSRYELQITQVLLINVVRLHPKHGLVNDVGNFKGFMENPTLTIKDQEFAILA